MTQDVFDTLAELARRRLDNEPVMWVPIDEDGDDAGPPEADFPPPAGNLN